PGRVRGRRPKGAVVRHRLEGRAAGSDDEDEFVELSRRPRPTLGDESNAVALFPNLEGQPLAAEEGANRRFENCSGSREDDLDPGIGRNRSLVDLFPPKLGDVGGDEPEYVVQPRRLDPDSPIATREEVSDAHAAGDARVVGNPVAVDVDRREAVLDRLVELGEGPQIGQTLADHRATFATSRNGERPFPQSVGNLVPDPRYLDGAGAARRLETGAVHPDRLERQAPIALEEHDGTDHVHPAVDGSF